MRLLSAGVLSVVQFKGLMQRLRVPGEGGATSLVEGQPKSRTSARVIPYPDFLRAFLQREGGARQYILSGSEIRPKPTVFFDGVELVEGVDYTLSYRDNVNAGIGTVIATGIALSSSTASVASLEAQVAARNATIAEQTSQILALEDDTLLSGMATEQGMSHVSSVTEFELLPVEDAPAVTANTNWFDRFCDWLSKIL